LNAYLILTGTLFGVIGIAHLLHLFIEEHSLADAWFVGSNLAIFVVGGGVAVWAARLLVGLRNHSPNNRSWDP
jgi:hypothetical protein